MGYEKAIEKKEALVRSLKKMGSLLVAYSGGVDSSFLLFTAHLSLPENVWAVTAQSALHPSEEHRYACEFALTHGINHVVIRTNELSFPRFVENAPDRCYHCKKNLLEALRNIAQEKGIAHVAHGANLDDMADYRPGMQAAREAGVIAPLLDVGLSKEEIRHLSKELGLDTWNRPATACLASRIPYGSSITQEKLSAIQEAERFLREKGLGQVRVRHYGSLAKLETSPEEWEELFSYGLREEVLGRLRELGFEHIAVDLEGYVAGKMNRDISKNT
jgi:uncharacterized protein